MKEDKQVVHAGDARNWQEFREQFSEAEWKRLYYCEWLPGERVEKPFAPHHITDMLVRECPELLK